VNVNLSLGSPPIENDRRVGVSMIILRSPIPSGVSDTDGHLSAVPSPPLDPVERYEPLVRRALDAFEHDTGYALVMVEAHLLHVKKVANRVKLMAAKQAANEARKRKEGAA
jgi:hypothetical protein